MPLHRLRTPPDLETGMASQAQARRETSPVKLHLPAPPEWVVDALCASGEPEDWFPDTRRGPPTRATSKLARTLCHGCPVQRECFEYALTFGPTLEGVWGGTTAEERRALLKRGAA
jgi:WhiB family redox-sensing transcriptional regulator